MPAAETAVVRRRVPPQPDIAVRSQLPEGLLGAGFASDRFRRTVANHEREFCKDLMARYLAKHGYPVKELLQGLLREPSAHGAAWLLALDYARDQLPSLLHLSQQTGDDETRRRAQAVLALLNKGDSDGELRAEMEKASKHDTAPYVGWGIRKFPGWDRLMDSEEALNKGDQ